jgi:NADH:ubiquinone oxidoreductase subunit E
MDFPPISEDHVSWFSRQLDIPESRFFGVITFYPKFRTRPVGKNTITVCIINHRYRIILFCQFCNLI